MHRDHATGEILCGGNTFVRVEYAEQVYASRAEEIARVIQATPIGVMVGLPGGFRAARVRGAYAHLEEVVIGGPRLGRLEPTHVYPVHGVDFAAERIAIAYLDAAARGELLEPDAEQPVTADDTLSIETPHER